MCLGCDEIDGDVGTDWRLLHHPAEEAVPASRDPSVS